MGKPCLPTQKEWQGIKKWVERQILPLVSEFYEQKITNYLSHRAPWLYSGIIISTALDMVKIGRVILMTTAITLQLFSWAMFVHKTLVQSIKHPTLQNQRQWHPIQSIRMAAGEQKLVIQKSVQPEGFFHVFFQKKKNKTEKKKTTSPSPSSQSDQPWMALSFTRIRWPRSCGHLPPGPVQPKFPTASLAGGFPQMVALPSHWNYHLVN